MRQKLYVVYFNIALICFLLVGMEVAGQVLFLAWKGYPLYESDRHLISHENPPVFELHPYLVGRLRGNARFEHDGRVITTTPEHTRWTGADLTDTAAVRIAVVGGSTTFGSGVSDSASWPARLQALLGPGYAVVNFGMPGFSSGEAVIQMALVVPESRPDVVVFFEGWNDLHNEHDSALGPDYFNHGVRQYSNLNIQRPEAPGLFARLSQVSAIVRLAAVGANWLRGPEPAEPPSAAPAVKTLRSDPDSFVERIYRRNLRTLHLLAGASGAYALFVPQVMDTSRLVSDTAAWWTPQIRNNAVPVLIHRLNLILGGACDDDRDRCAVFTGALEYPWTPADFIDEGHFSPQGNERFAELLAGEIRRVAGSPAGGSP